MKKYYFTFTSNTNEPVQFVEATSKKEAIKRIQYVYSTNEKPRIYDWHII